MVSYTNSLRLILPDTGSYTNSWGGILNTSVFTLADQGVAGYVSIVMSDADYTLTSINGTSDQARNAILAFSGTLSAAKNVFAPAVSKVYTIKNSTTGGFAITIKTTAGGSTGISIPNGNTITVWSDGTNFYESTNSFSSLTLTNLTYTGTLTGGTGVIAIGTNQIYKDAGGNIGFGTATPAAATNYKFVTVQSPNIAGGAGYTIYNSAGVEVGRSFFDATAWQFNNFSATLPTTFSTNSVERLRIDSTGNVGIGITAALGKLHVVDALSAPIYFDEYSNSTGQYIASRAAKGTIATPVAVTSGWLLSSYRGFGHNGTDFGSYAASINFYSAQAFTPTAQGSLITFETTALSAVVPTERMRIDNAGNVGIGNTPSGTYKLEVTGNVSSTTGFVGPLNGTVGASTPAAGIFTTLVANTNINSTRINPRIGTTTGAASPITPTSDASDQYNVTAAGAALTIAIPSGTPVNGQKLMLRIKDNGTARVLTWTTSAGGYRIIGTTLPTTTVISKTIYVGCIYNAADSFWDVVAVTQEA